MSVLTPRMARWTRGGAIASCAVALLGCPLLTPPHASVDEQAGGQFVPSALCRNCHDELSTQHDESMHAKSYSNPVFQKTYRDLFLPAFDANPEAFVDEPACLACHAPISHLQGRLAVDDLEPTDERVDDEPATEHTDIEPTLEPVGAEPVIAGVTCDLCHRITGIDGPVPRDGNFIASPGDVKLGPYPYEKDHHREYSELHTKSEFCALCHSSGNRHGVSVRTTFEEWQTSPQAAAGIRCQDCHMTVDGFLTGGKSTYQAGAAASMSLGTAPDREKIYTHRFVGAHSQTQIGGALEIEIAPRRGEALPGNPLPIGVVVHNDKTAHKVPTGSPELRSAWLEVRAKAGDTEIPMRLTGDKRPWGVTGRTREDRALLGEAVPPGLRIYRAVFVNARKEPTYLTHEAIRMVFDNRLEAGEERTELFHIQVPQDLTGTIVMDATLYYQRFPAAFSEALGLDPVPAVPIATGHAEIPVHSAE